MRLRPGVLLARDEHRYSTGCPNGTQYLQGGPCGWLYQPQSLTVLAKVMFSL